MQKDLKGITDTLLILAERMNAGQSVDTASLIMLSVKQTRILNDLLFYLLGRA
jgi:hypothetical protein